jgi:hypothetical protein
MPLSSLTILQLNVCIGTKMVPKRSSKLAPLVSKSFHPWRYIYPFYTIFYPFIKYLFLTQTGTKEQQKAVFIASEAVSGITEMAIRDIILGSRFEHCIVITAAPATIHTSIRTTEGPPADDPNNLRAFVELENRLLRWMGNSVRPKEL